MNADSAQFGTVAGASHDLDLVHAAKNGDVSAFEQLVGRYDRKLRRIAQHVTHNREDAQDAVQEAFLKAFQQSGPISRGFAVLNMVDPHHCEPITDEVAKAAFSEGGVPR